MNSIGPVPRPRVPFLTAVETAGRRFRAYMAVETAYGFEDPWGRVEFRTGPEGPLTQRSINRLGGSLIVFSEGPHFTARDRLSHQGARGGRFVNRWSVSEIEIGQKGPSSLRPALEMPQHGSQDWTLRLAVGAASTP